MDKALYILYPVTAAVLGQLCPSALGSVYNNNDGTTPSAQKRPDG